MAKDDTRPVAIIDEKFKENLKAYMGVSWNVDGWVKIVGKRAFKRTFHSEPLRLNLDGLDSDQLAELAAEVIQVLSIKGPAPKDT